MMELNDYRYLTPEERKELVDHGCSAENWDTVRVEDGFSTASVGRCRFEGEVYLGRNVVIDSVSGYIRNYIIDSGAVIRSVDIIECNTRSRFGNGVQSTVINEGGGREVPIYDRLTAQTAYIVALYRHRKLLIERICSMIDNYASGVESTLGHIAGGVHIISCRIIRNARIGRCADLQGVEIVDDCSIGSHDEFVTRIGAGVKMYDSITAEGACVVDGSLLRRCFVGQGVTVGNFTATDTICFADSHLENGEACSVFAGPFTVSHHKSTLLIAGMFSFFNAGSGSNQSNHLFKAGAIHQGIHQRGCKFASDAYIMLPAKDGAFTVVIGRHKSHHNTENFPFSYLIEDGGASFLLPAFSLGSFGTERDLQKWPLRDVRPDGFRRDKINFEEHNPFICERIMRARDLCRNLMEHTAEIYNYERIRIRAVMLKRGASLYELAANKYLGAMLSTDCRPNPDGCGAWIDVAGEYMPRGAMERLVEAVEQGSIDSLEGIDAAFATMAADYGSFAAGWARAVLAAELGHEASEQDIAEAVERGCKAAASLQRIVDADRRRDTGIEMSTGYGIDAIDASEIEDDFRAVRRC